MVGPLGQIVQPLLQEKPFLFKMIAVSMKIHGDRLSVDEDSFRERVGQKKTIPAVEDLFPGGTEGNGDHRPSRQPGQFDNADLDPASGAPRSIRNEHHNRPVLECPKHVFEGGKPFPGGRSKDRLKTKPLEGLSYDLTVPMRRDKETYFQALMLVSEGHHQKPSMPEGANDNLAFFKNRFRNIQVYRFKAHGHAKDLDDPVSQPRTEPSH